MVAAVVAMTVMLGFISARIYGSDPIVGLWSYQIGTRETVRFLEDGTVADSPNGAFGPSTYKIQGNRVTISSTQSGDRTYQFEIEGDFMCFTEIKKGTALSSDLWLQRME